jgi:hypothetical protein
MFDVVNQNKKQQKVRASPMVQPSYEYFVSSIKATSL